MQLTAAPWTVKITCRFADGTIGTSFRESDANLRSHSPAVSSSTLMLTIISYVALLGNYMSTSAPNSQVLMQTRRS